MLLNKEIFDKLLQEFGYDNTLIYCNMEARRCEIEDKEESETSYDKHFWEIQIEHLKNKNV